MRSKLFIYFINIIFLLMISITPFLLSFQKTNNIGTLLYLEKNNNINGNETDVAHKLKNWSFNSKNSDYITKSGLFINKDPSDNLNTFSSSSVSDLISITKNSTRTLNNSLNLFIMTVFNNTEHRFDSVIMVTNLKGQVISEINLGKADTVPFYSSFFINSTTVFVQSNNFPFLWNFYTNKSFSLPFTGHHAFAYNPLNKSFFTYESQDVNISNTIYVFDEIKEYDYKGKVIWSLNTSDFVSINEECPFKDQLGVKVDLTHGNALTFDPKQQILFVHLRNLNTFYTINYTTKEVLWAVGEHGTFSLYDIKGKTSSSLFYHAHGMKKIDENRFILFDNDFHNQTSTADQRSRAIEIEVDVSAKVARIVRVWYPPSSEYNCDIWGDADVLPNNDLLVTFGDTDKSNPNDSSIISEVSQENKIIWEMRIKKSPELIGTIYTADRFLLSPYLQLPLEVSNFYGEEIAINWTAAYNIWLNEERQGEYCIYLDNKVLENGKYTFQSYWQQSHNSTILTNLSLGYHNLTIKVSDGEGHFTTKSTNISVVSYKIERYGRIAIEKGQNNSKIVWVGKTVSPLVANIEINSFIVDTTVWTGQNLSIDLNNYDTGTYTASLYLVNTSNIIYFDNFTFFVYPLASPEILNEPNINNWVWGQKPILAWTIFDSTPKEWKIFVNNTLFYENEWNNQYLTLNWSCPVIDEGTYNISLFIYDQGGLYSNASLIVKILSPSPPIISETPPKTEFQYKIDDIHLYWVIHGGSNYWLFRNESLISYGSLTSHIVVYNSSNCSWEPGEYNVSLTVKDKSNKTAYSSIIVRVWLNKGDPYVDSILPQISDLYRDGKNLIGAPDGKYAEIILAYASGYIVADMGMGEEIVNGLGNDFTVYAKGGEYLVSVTNDPYSTFYQLGYGSNNQSFDLADSPYDSVRYVKIQYVSGAFVFVDAIEALYYNKPIWDNSPPVLISNGNVTVTDKVISVKVTWGAYDQSPSNYTILLNGKTFIVDEWDGKNISCVVPVTNQHLINVTLIATDLWGHSSSDSVFIIIKPTVKITVVIVYSTIGLSLLSAIIYVLVKYKLKIKRRKS